MKNITLGNRYEIEWSSERKDTATGAWEVDASHSGFTVSLSASDGGATIHANLTAALTERSETPGTYYAQISGANITTHLTASLGSTVYEVITDSAGDVKRSQPLRVVSVARPD
jgi:hypothetical protein